MAKKDRTISIREFERIYPDGKQVFKEDVIELKNSIDEYNSKYLFDDEEAHIDEFLKPIKNGIQANNYVGVLQTKSGLTIEILPKITGKTEKATDNKVRKLFVEMLKTVRDIKGKRFKTTKLDTQKTNILEIFISMFLAESDSLIKRGLKSAYVSFQSNERFLKGKLSMTQHIRKNSVNQAYFYNEYDEFMVNSPENQIIKTTLNYLLQKSKDVSNLRLIREQLTYFELVDLTYSPDKVLKKVSVGKDYKYYEQVLDWCKIFLGKKSFSSFKGESLAFAILFPMEEIFESYIAQKIKNVITDANVSIQDNKYSLFDRTNKTNAAYRIRPDLVLRFNDDTTTIVDTKWKVLDNFGPYQPDLYQMYVYYTRYYQKAENIDKVILLYPYSDNYDSNEFRSTQKFSDELSAKVQIRFVDLLADDINQQLLKLFE